MKPFAILPPAQRHLRSSRNLLVPFTILVCCLSSAFGADRPVPKSPVAFEHMTCEYLDSPQGIDTTVPRLSWQEASAETAFRQAAYRIVVASSPTLLAAGKGDLWDSGKVKSSLTTLIPYGGRPLTSRRQCWWAVQVWTAQGKQSPWSRPATFSMGLLAKQDWKALWIGKEAPGRHVDLSLLAGAHWIWFPEGGQPSNAAPLGSRYFRIAVALAKGRPIKRARFVGTADTMRLRCLSTAKRQEKARTGFCRR